MKKSVSMVVDRIEDDRAALVLGEDENVKLSLPVKLLPDGVKSGDHLEVTFKIDRGRTEEVAGEVEDLLEKLKRKR
ncbi:MAG TPA: DUF3006 domain-containing protein [Blastocatellia bacterium]|nr:DUF3006 domain-containing protein [Blastocatellia bacterium]